jgi:hypothetical protein
MSESDSDSDEDIMMSMKIDNSNVNMGLMRFDDFLKERLLDSNSKRVITDSRNYRIEHFDEPLDMIEYLSSDVVQEVNDNLSNGIISEGRILTEYTQDNEANDLKGQIKDDNGENHEIQVNFPVCFRLVKFISSFPTILTSLGGSVVQLPGYIMEYLKNENLIEDNDSEIPFNLKKKFIIDWIRINNIFCKQIYRILDNWPKSLPTSFTVYTGFNFEIPNIGDFRNSMIERFRSANEGDIIMIPFVLSTSISPFVAKRFAQNETDIILQITIPSGFSIPYISKEESQELEVLLNMFGHYKVSRPDAMKYELQDVGDRVICLQLEGFEELDNSILDKSTKEICDIISRLEESDENTQSQNRGGKKNKRRPTKKRNNKDKRYNKRRPTKKRNNKDTLSRTLGKKYIKKRTNKRKNNRRRTNKRYNKKI